jgi:hypothetical protein
MKNKKILDFRGYLYDREVKKIDESFYLVKEDDQKERSRLARIKVNRALIWININRGFFARLLANLNIYGSSKLNPKTMATNGLNIVYHPDFVLSQSEAAIRFVLCHEILHCVGDHMTRRGNRDPLIWNYAADYAINPILDAEYVKDQFDWPKNPDGGKMGLYEEKYAGMTAEVIYDLLMEDPDIIKKTPGGLKEIFGGVEDSDRDLPEPDDDESIVQEVPSDEEGDFPVETGRGPGGKPEGEPKGELDLPTQEQLVGKKIRITEGPNKGRIGTIKQVLPNGNVIIE